MYEDCITDISFFGPSGMTLIPALIRRQLKLCPLARRAHRVQSYELCYLGAVLTMGILSGVAISFEDSNAPNKRTDVRSVSFWQKRRDTVPPWLLRRLGSGASCLSGQDGIDLKGHIGICNAESGAERSKSLSDPQESRLGRPHLSGSLHIHFTAVPSKVLKPAPDQRVQSSIQAQPECKRVRSFGHAQQAGFERFVDKRSCDPLLSLSTVKTSHSFPFIWSNYINATPPDLLFFSTHYFCSPAQISIHHCAITQINIKIKHVPN